MTELSPPAEHIIIVSVSAVEADGAPFTPVDLLNALRAVDVRPRGGDPVEFTITLVSPVLEILLRPMPDDALEHLQAVRED